VGTAVRAIAVEENAAVLVEPDGNAKIVGDGPAYFLRATSRSLTEDPASLQRCCGTELQQAPFDLREWMVRREDYSLSVKNGRITANLRARKFTRSG
jgi:cyanophycinase-like exopeptidase